MLGIGNAVIILSADSVFALNEFGGSAARGEKCTQLISLETVPYVLCTRAQSNLSQRSAEKSVTTPNSILQHHCARLAIRLQAISVDNRNIFVRRVLLSNDSNQQQNDKQRQLYTNFEFSTGDLHSSTCVT